MVFEMGSLCCMQPMKTNGLRNGDIVPHAAYIKLIVFEIGTLCRMKHKWTNGLWNGASLSHAFFLDKWSS